MKSKVNKYGGKPQCFLNVRHNREHSLNYFISEIKYCLGFTTINFQGRLVCLHACFLFCTEKMRAWCWDNLGFQPFAAEKQGVGMAR